MDRTAAFFISTLLVAAVPICALLSQQLQQQQHPHPHPSWIVEAASADPSFIVDFIQQHNLDRENKDEEGCESCWTLVTDLVQSPPSNVKVHLLGEMANFTRPAPKSLDPNLLENNWQSFNLLQVRRVGKATQGTDREIDGRVNS